MTDLKEASLGKTVDYPNKSFFFQLSGIHPELPSIEIFSILKGEEFQYNVLEKKDQFLLLNCSEQAAYKTAERAAYCRRSVELLYRSEVGSKTTENIAKNISEHIEFTKLLQKEDRFKVRVYRIGKAQAKHVSIHLEKAIGDMVWEQTNGACKADMKNPTIIFIVMFTENDFFFGRETFSRKKGSFTDRRPDLRPYFKPGTLEPRFARLMVNLSRAKPGEYLLDPFCGPGGILIEGAIIGCKILGSDLDKRMVKGSKKNIDYYAPSNNAGFVISDAKQLPFKNKIKSIATDPPYGRSTSTYGKEIEDLLTRFLQNASQILEKDGIIAIGMFEEVPLQEIVEKSGFILEHFEKIYIHRSLTRRIGVCRLK